MENPFDLASKRIKVASESARDQTCRRWEDLPINCLVLIFEKVGVMCLTLGVPFVCKSWYEASLDPACWKVLDLRGSDVFFQGSCFGEEFKHEYHVNKFTLRGFLKFLVRRSNNLATKLFTGDVNLNCSDMAYLFEECPELDIISGQTRIDPKLFRQFVLRIHAIMTAGVAKVWNL